MSRIFSWLVMAIVFLYALDESVCVQTTTSVDEPRKTLLERFHRVLQVPVPFSDEEEREECQRLVKRLTKEELNVAARTSYAFWYVELHGQGCVSPELLERAALREARRHLVASNGDVAKSLERLQDVCHHRQEHQLDVLRSCFETDNDAGAPTKADSILPTGAAPLRTKKEFRELVSVDLRRQAVIVVQAPRQGGKDDGQRSSEASTAATTTSTNIPILLKGAREVSGTTEEEYLTTQLYIVERANACLEYISGGHEEKMISILDFSTFQSGNSPPLQWQVSAIRLLQHLYPERMQQLIIVGPPFWMRSLLRGVKALLPRSTQERIEVAKDRAELAQILSTGALLEHLESVDIDRYLYETPVYCPYNDSGECKQGHVVVGDSVDAQ